MQAPETLEIAVAHSTAQLHMFVTNSCPFAQVLNKRYCDNVSYDNLQLLCLNLYMCVNYVYFLQCHMEEIAHCIVHFAAQDYIAQMILKCVPVGILPKERHEEFVTRYSYSKSAFAYVCMVMLRHSIQSTSCP